MKNLSRRQRNNLIIAGLCAIVVLMGVGYAAFASQLRINGTSNISSNFNVLITDITSGSIVGGASNATEPTYTNTTATFNTNLVSPGDSITYKITVENQGSIDATLSSIDVNTGSNDAIVFETSGIKEGDNLLKEQSDELYVKVTYNSSVTSQPTNTNSTITVTLNYTQAGIGDDGVVLPTETVSLGGQNVETVTYGDGLYADEYEAGRYVYKGTNPNNYIEFDNGEVWRIIAKETDGTYKILKNDVLEAQDWDTTNNNEWAAATLNIYLNGEYYNNLELFVKSNIVSHNWGVGAVTHRNNDLVEQIIKENEKLWSGNIGLISASDYLRANSNNIQCGTYLLNNINYNICRATNWLLSKESYWTISSSDYPYVLYIYSEGYIGCDSVFKESNGGVFRAPRPAAYLNSNITLTGTGTQNDPYKIVS